MTNYHSCHGSWIEAIRIWRELGQHQDPIELTYQHEDLLRWYNRRPRSSRADQRPTHDKIPTPLVDEILAEVDELKAKDEVYIPRQRERASRIPKSLCSRCGKLTFALSWTCDKPTCPKVFASDPELNQKIQHHLKKKDRVERPGPKERKEATSHDDDPRPLTDSNTKPKHFPQQQSQTAPLAQERTDMKRNEAFPSKYLKASDLNGEDLTVTIDSLEWEEIGQEKKAKPVLYFRGKIKKPLILNGTNWDKIAEVTCEDDSDHWGGKKIILFRTEVQFKSQMVEAIRVRGSVKATTKKTTEPDANDDVPY